MVMPRCRGVHAHHEFFKQNPVYPHGERDLVTEKQDNPSRDEILKRMLKMKPKPHGKDAPKRGRPKPGPLRHDSGGIRKLADKPELVWPGVPV
jgi:hypothetical protein